MFAYSEKELCAERRKRAFHMWWKWNHVDARFAVNTTGWLVKEHRTMLSVLINAPLQPREVMRVLSSPFFPPFPVFYISEPRYLESLLPNSRNSLLFPFVVLSFSLLPRYTMVLMKFSHGTIYTVAIAPQLAPVKQHQHGGSLRSTGRPFLLQRVTRELPTCATLGRNPPLRGRRENRANAVFLKAASH